MNRLRAAATVVVVAALAGCIGITGHECSCAPPIAVAVVVGRVLSANGTPFASALVNAQALDASCSAEAGGRYDGFTPTDTNGAFELTVANDKDVTACVRLTARAELGPPVGFASVVVLRQGVRFRFATSTTLPDTVRLDVILP